MPQPHRILLTGATGFIGQHVHRALLDAGHHVTAVIRPERVDVPLDPRCEILRASLFDAKALRIAVQTSTAVIALAGAVRGNTGKQFATVNSDSISVLRGVMETDAAEVPLLLMSSLAASQPELSDYAASKRSGEAIITQSSLRWCALRPPAVYGPGEQELRPLLNWLVRGVIIVPGSPTHRVSFIHVADLTAACLAWLDHVESLQRRIFTLDDGTSGGYDWADIEAAVCDHRRIRLVIPPGLLKLLGRLNAAWAKLTGVTPMLSPGKVNELLNPHWVGSGETEGNNAFTASTGWAPRWTLKAGVQQTMKTR